MMKLVRSISIANRFFGVLLLAVVSPAETRPPIADQIAKAYGLDSFGQIDAIRYTFHAQFPGVNLSRSWTWQPKTGEISYQGKDKDGKPVRVTYVQSRLRNETDNVRNEIDPAFYNDQYWLLFPLHVSWDTSADVRDTGRQKAPLGKGDSKRVEVKYPMQGGYTPGDTWELFLGPGNRVEEFIFHRGGPKKPSVVIATWSGYRKAGPLLIATDHRGTADGQPLRVFFSDVAVKLSGSNAWVSAE